VDPVPDPLLSFSGSAGNRTRASGSQIIKKENSPPLTESTESHACRSLWVTVHTFAPSLGPPDRSPEPEIKMPVSVRAVALVSSCSKLGLNTICPD
jgi:hypothetical protein